MEHQIKAVAITKDINSGEDLKGLGDYLTIFSGKGAGVCYMPDDYLSEGIQNEEKALSRAKSNSKSGHHSVYDHGHISFTIKSSKMICMILNSLGVYTTSEKSARYTKMQPETELELQTYEKWRKKLQALILNTYPKIDDIELSKRLCKKLGMEYSPYTVVGGSFSHIKEDGYMEELLNELKRSETLPSYKLAQENARYMISVFTPTTMMYTISYRQLCLTYDYFVKLQENLENCDNTNFNARLLKEVNDFLKELERITNEIGKPLSDNKNQYIRFLDSQVSGAYTKSEEGFKFNKFTDDEIKSRKTYLQGEKDHVCDTYKLVYFGSLAMLAQAQRHRTLRYKMNLETAGEYDFYIPEILKSIPELKQEWLSDIKKLADYIPQGTIVRITEQGLFEDFVLKCKERLCGRAQLEIMKSTVVNAHKFIANKKELSYNNQKLLETIIDEKGTLVPRCAFKDFKCSEGCSWGKNGAFERLI